MWSPEAITIACLIAAKPYVHGITSLEFTVDVHDLTLPISPWYCKHFDDSIVLNHLISLDVSTMDMDVFLAGLLAKALTISTRRNSRFFPKVQQGTASVPYVTAKVTTSLHTLVQAHDMGFWYKHLPAHIQSECIGYILPCLLLIKPQDQSGH
jgi:hypothetical protein